MINSSKRFLSLLVLVFIALTSLTPLVSADEFSPIMGPNDTTHYNVSYSLDRGTSTQWELWIISGIIGLILFLLSLRSRDNAADNEVDAIVSVVSWIPIAYCAYASFNVDRLVGTGVSGTTNVVSSSIDYIMLQSHILYSNTIIGVIMVIFLLVAIANTIRIISLHKTFGGGDV